MPRDTLTLTVHGQIHLQVERTPERVSVQDGRRSLTYAELDDRSTQIARYLQQEGVRPGHLVAVLLGRSVDVPVALLGVLKAGGAYVPLDTSYPSARIADILADAQPHCILTDDTWRDRLPSGVAPVHTLEGIAASHTPDTPSALSPAADHQLAYVMYTSGSTGRPKGVMVTHRNLASLFDAMATLLGRAEPEVWLAGTSIAFDISVVELLWPLTRGGTVIIEHPATETSNRPLEFSLFYFAAHASACAQPYRLLLEGARFADTHDFAAVWMPERHFHAFGGLFPNPAVTAAAVAAVTDRIQIRAGSVVLPLQDPLRVVEEWSVVDNLSAGRVGLSFASGWNARDFVLAPDAFVNRKADMAARIDDVRRLWRGEAVRRPDGEGRESEVRAFPAPVQRELPCWLTVAGSTESFREGGRLGLGILTHLIGQSIDELSEQIRVYRVARTAAGHVGPGHVALMLHTFVHAPDTRTRETVHGPLRQYLDHAADLLTRAADTTAGDIPVNDRAALLDHAFERYFSDCGLFGVPEQCLQRLDEVRGAGVDEVACLIDFGISDELVLAGLPHLARLQQLHREVTTAPVSHFQCTPSRLRMLLADERGRALLSSLRYLLVGGEPFPADVAAKVCALVPGVVLNLYGPTEATIWSTADTVSPEASVTIGRPLANTEVLILDANGGLVPPGGVGEICIAGEGVAAGYWRAPEASAARFVPHPFGEGTVYRTGDLARTASDGRLEFLGRSDRQVKILGHRVELEEIESALAESTEVGHAAVQLIDHDHGHRLVAFVAPGPERRWTDTASIEHQLRHDIADRMPEWMRPSEYVFLDALPLTAGGKLAREALPVLAHAATQPVEHDSHPHDRLDQILIREWSALLGVSDLGLDDDFFRRGGHSLLAVQLVVRVRHILQIDLPVRVVFEAPTVRRMAAWLIRAHPELTEGDAGARDAAPPSEESGPVPLTFAQRRIWFMEQLRPGQDTNNLVRSVRVHGALDPETLRRVCTALAHRHDGLRTQVTMVDGVPHQHFPTRSVVAFDVVHLQTVPEDLRGPQVDRAVRSATRQLFDLQTGPLWRVVLIIVSPTESILVAVMHHLIADDRSLEVLLHELFDDYASLAGGVMPQQRRSPRFRTWAERQHAREAAGAFTEPIRYWHDQLLGAPPSVGLPRDVHASTETTAGMGQVGVALDTDLRAGLQSVARRCHATVAAVFLASFALLLQRLTGQDDVVVGCPVAGRTDSDTQDVLGCFVNPLPLRLRRDGASTFAAWLTAVRQVLFAGLAHQDFPFDRVVRDLRGPRHPDHLPLFQVMFNHMAVPAPLRAPAGITVEVLAQTEFDGALDLTMYVFESESAIGVTLAFANRLFSQPRMQEMLGQYVLLLRQVVADPDAPLDQHTLVTEEGRRHLPDPCASLGAVWHGAAVEHMARQRARRPQGAAILHKEAASYEALDRAANRLACRLLESGITRGDVVAIYSDRCPALVVAMIAVHKIAAAFMVLDAGYPTPRVVAHCRAVNPRAWIHCTSRTILPADLIEWLDTQPWACRVEGLGESVRSVDQALHRCSDAPCQHPIGPADLAYVAFTSGSTGRPVAVRCNHGALSHYLAWQTSRFQMGPDDRVTMISGLSHDPLLRDILAPLWVGAVVCIPDADHPLSYLDPLWLRDWFRRAGITVTHLTPGIGRVLTARGHDDDRWPTLERLRLVFFAGEPLTGADVTSLRGLAPAATCVNLFGTTESQLANGGYFVCDDSAGALAVVPVGLGITDVQLLVATDGGQQAGVGELGEIFIRAPYVADGYVGEPELTSRKFVRNPLTQKSDDRVIRTGDLGRYRLDGQVEFCGRTDRQVKIQGCRIEPEEIEAAVRVVAGVRGCLVLALAGTADDKELVAYVTTGPEDAGAIAARVRSSIRTTLPSWMCPRHVVTMAEWPLTPNGKIDRAKLPTPGPTESGLGSRTRDDTPADEKTRLEDVLTRAWTRVLGVVDCDVHDDFFALGGSSLDVVRLLHEIQQETGQVVPLVDFYREPTIQRLAVLLREPRRAPGAAPATRLSAGHLQPRVFFVHARLAQLPLYSDLVLRLPAEQETYSVGPEEVKPNLTGAQIRGLATHYADEILRVQPAGPYVLAGYSFGGVLAYETAVRIESLGGGPVTLVLFDSHIPPYGPRDWTNRLSLESWRPSNLRQHVDRLWRQPPRAAAAYLGARATTLWTRLQQRPPIEPPTYVPAAFRGRLLLFRSTRQGYVQAKRDRTNGWGRFVEGPVEVVEVAGSHREVLREAGLATVAQRLTQLLQEMRAGST